MRLKIQWAGVDLTTGAMSVCSEFEEDGTTSQTELWQFCRGAPSCLVSRAAWLMSNRPWAGIDLSEGEVHLWRVSLDQFEMSPLLCATLSADEQVRRNSFRSEREWKRFVVGRVLLRAILGRYLGIIPGEIRLCYNRRGKPSLGGPQEARRVRFNLSHSGGLALYAVTLDREIGVDLERVSDIPGLQQIADRFFSRHERALIHDLRDVQKGEAFFRIWTRKEALLKARGQGLSGLTATAGDPMDWTSVRSLRDLCPKRNRSSGWSIAELGHLPGFAAAIAVEGRISRLLCLDVNAQYHSLLHGRSFPTERLPLRICA